MLNILVRKLQLFEALPPDSRKLLEIHANRVEHLPAHAAIIQEGDAPSYLNVVLAGWACRYKQLEDGRRQIVAFFVPGDMCDPCVFLLDAMSHTLATLTPCTVVRIAEADVSAMMAASASLRRAFWFEMLAGAEVQREWTVSLGRRTAVERMAHLFCEILTRLRAVGLAKESECDMPVRQADLGDALGLSAVHVNRTLQELRSMRLVQLRGRRLVIHNEAALATLALFDPTYLHLQRSAPAPKAALYV